MAPNLNMIKKISLGIFTLFLVSFIPINDFKNLVLSKLNSYSDNYPEKVYVQTDKPYYTLGEDLWFSAYLLNGIDHKRSNKSRVIHIELINEKDSIVSQRLLYTDDISVAGDFKIDKGWQEGTYILRAYTNYMRNQNDEFLFKKEIPIWNLNINDDLTKTKTIKKNKGISDSLQNGFIPKLNFFPEGGYMVDGIPSKIGIKALDQFGNDIEIKGLIKDSEENIIAIFETLKFGLGFTTFTPTPNTNYFASIKINDQEVSYPLPNALKQGYNLSLINNGMDIKITATANIPLGLKNSFLVAHQRGKVIFERLESSNINKYSLKLIASSLQDGIANFTLFDNQGKPVCERLIFIDNPDNTVITTINNRKSTYKQREEVVLYVDVNDIDKNSLSGNFSLSVTDLDIVAQNTNHENIKTYLLLNSDLRGKIKNPGYFFEKENDPTRRFLLDLVMLTHGWRRFTWNGLLNKDFTDEVAYKPEAGIIFNGHTTALNQTAIKFSASTRFTLMGSGLVQEQMQSDTKGEFKFGPYVVFDSVPGFIEARVHGFSSQLKNNRDVSIFLDNKYYYSPRVNRNSLLKFRNSDDSKIRDFLQQSESILNLQNEYQESFNLLDEVVVTATKKSEKQNREEFLDERTDYGFPTRRLDVQNVTNFESMSLYDLLNQMPSVRVLNDSVKIRNNVNAKVLFDNFEVELRDISYLTGNDIEFIDLLTGADAAFYSGAANGIIAIYSRIGIRASTSNVKRKPGIIDFTTVGFYTAREFYSPDYINDIDLAIKPDIRSTLFWEPKLKLDGSKMVRISFFTCDKKSRYGITLEGMSHTGIPVYHFSTIDVE